MFRINKPHIVYMKYFNLPALDKSIRRIREGNSTHEHRTGTAANGLANNYFDKDKYTVTPEQIQIGSRKKPDLSIEKYDENTDELTHHCFIEVKSLINSSIPKIVEQLHETILFTVDELGLTSGTFSTFIIAIKGTRIAFYTYHSFSTLLDEYGIPNYKGFIPLNYLIGKQKYMAYMENNGSFPIAEVNYDRYVRRITFPYDRDKLNEIGAIPTDSIKHPHILDLLNDSHKNHIHEMFVFMSKYSADSLL